MTNYKDVHKEITRRFKKAFSRKKRKGESVYKYIKKNVMKRIINEVYYDMPELKKEALKQINNHFRRAPK